ncbi:hypothetical protein [Geitlerinema sp. PCC 9228]|jgi:hypothetical protein|uniref:hypothetical protein n=1 Tax=Geitlerinema sp. PCC 9228 TaxID=111611 RepID=UPI0008F99064|nr:hypothetical protein [Geitlerinema sp. PCC 9228]
MARYTGLFVVAVSVEGFRQLLAEMLESCGFDIIYDTGDYMMAREVPGKVPFGKLVTVEILIDKTTTTNEEVHMNFVLKNEELPLQVNNHCHQMFDLLSNAIANNQQWKLLESVAG